MKYKILLVDDEPANLRVLEKLFRRDFTVLTASSGAAALQLLDQHDVALLITDQRMPQMTGIELLKIVTTLRPHMVRMILTGYTDVDALVEAINGGQVYKYVTKPWNNQDLQLTVSRAIQHYETNRKLHELKQVNERLVARQSQTQEGIVQAFFELIKQRDGYLAAHALRVTRLSLRLGLRLHLAKADLQQLSLAAVLHDVGRAVLTEQIINETDSLAGDSGSSVESCAERSSRILSFIPEFAEIAELVMAHREHYDGTGYPRQLQAAQIPIGARIILVADEYQTLLNARCDDESISTAAALQAIESRAGIAFDPDVVRALSAEAANIQQSEDGQPAAGLITPGIAGVISVTHEAAAFALHNLN
jgi:response regulator RpfG family c-di-GMP phosphodiesterase